jgi:hypothetical protein
MSDAAHDYQTIQPASTVGLQDLFEVRELDASQDTSLVGLDANRDERGANLLSVEEASLRLGISIRAVQKRLKKGTLSGRKQKTLNGERWFVALRELDATLEKQDAKFVRLDANYDEPEANQGAQRDALVLQLQNKLEAASYRIGYLEAQLEAERNQVKLLTDSQHKPDWWRRAWRWFIGAPR